MPNMKALSLKVKKIYTMLKFADGQTDGQTVITIGHLPSCGALITAIKSNATGRDLRVRLVA